MSWKKCTINFRNQPFGVGQLPNQEREIQSQRHKVAKRKLQL